MERVELEGVWDWRRGGLDYMWGGRRGRDEEQ